jgi:hypothetical protein
MTVVVRYNQLLETCVKNCNIHFHRYACSRDLMSPLVNILKRRRKKLTFMEKLINLYKEPEFREIEDKILGLIQLWADTFMMQEDTYPDFMKYYREIRKDGVRFPPRDPNERYMIKFVGEASPAFELAEMEQQIQNLVTPNTTAKLIGRKNREQPKRVENQKEEEKKVEEPEVRFTYEDAFNLKNYLPVIQEALLKAEGIRDLQNPNLRDITRKMRVAHKKLIFLAAQKADEHMGEEDTAELLKILDYVNEKVEAFKKAITIIRNNRSEHELRSALGIESKPTEDPLDLLDLEDDFLSVPEANPLENIEKFVHGAPREFHEVKPREERKEKTIEIKDVIQDEKQPKRLEFPDLLSESLREEDFSHTISQQPKEHPSGSKNEDPFDLSSVVFNAEPKPAPLPVSAPISSTPQYVGYPQAPGYPMPGSYPGVYNMQVYPYPPQYANYPPYLPHPQYPQSLIPQPTSKNEDIFRDLV